MGIGHCLVGCFYRRLSNLTGWQLTGQLRPVLIIHFNIQVDWQIADVATNSNHVALQIIQAACSHARSRLASQRAYLL